MKTIEMIKTRNDLPKLMALKREGKSGNERMIELGVASGNYLFSVADEFKEAIGVDKWNDHHDKEEMEKVKEKAVIFNRKNVNSQVSIINSSFSDAADQFDECYFDFIYIDGYAHGAQEKGTTFLEWWGKLKRGGVMAGHDYHLNWPLNMKYINLFCKAVNREIYITQEKRIEENKEKRIWKVWEGPYPSFYIFK